MRGGVPRAALLAGLGLGVAAAAPAARIYGAENIKRHIQRHGRSTQVGNSLAEYRHENTREMARRVRQAERDRERQAARAYADERRRGIFRQPASDPPQSGLSRRGRRVLFV